MTEKEFLKKIHYRLAQTSIGTSALRNQGKKGLIKEARNYLINEFSLESAFSSLPNETEFLTFLDHHTEKLKAKFFLETSGWGAARKAINLFLRGAVYNRFISHCFHFSNDFEQFNKQIANLELPLDSQVAKGLNSDLISGLPKWPGIRYLDIEVSNYYQISAQKVAENEKIARVNLDLKYWRPEKV